MEVAGRTWTEYIWQVTWEVEVLEEVEVVEELLEVVEVVVGPSDLQNC